MEAIQHARSRRITGFGLKKAAEMLGVDQRSLSYWVDAQALPDLTLQELGKGNRREFTVANLIQISIMKELDKYAVSTRAMQRVLQALESGGYFDRLSNSDRSHEVSTVYVNESGYVELKNGSSVSIDDYRSLIQINLPRLEEDVARAIERARDEQEQA